MRKYFYALLTFYLISVSCTRNNEVSWKISDNPILTSWAADVDPLKPWLVYPRPDMARNEWISLNGLWDYSITSKDIEPQSWDGTILVPYPVESALSGVKKRINENQNIWYKRTFNIPRTWSKKHILLNFEAVDWETAVWVDGTLAGKHRGGYDPFTFDITKFLADKKSHELLVCVWDPTDTGDQPRGKQVSKPQGIFYTPTTGIWQTVWIEPVNESYISSFRTVTDIDKGTLSVNPVLVNGENKTVNVTVRKDGKKVAETSGAAGNELTMTIDKPELWSPSNPALYDISIELKDGNNSTDEINTYTGFRKISIGKTPDGYTRMLLNNEFLFQSGPLDQGFWPDGIYTPPTEKAMVYDLEMTKKMGFNMLRKHVKVENRVFYYWCDKLGILVWQDMPSCSGFIQGTDPDLQKPKESADQFETELKQMIETKFNHPSIIMWVPFNEGWGQYETGRITRLIEDYDHTRLVNSSSGWTDRGTGNISDIHNYPEPVAPPAEEKRAIVLGEFGGLGLALDGHTWEQKHWGYRNMQDTLDLLTRFEQFFDIVHRLDKEKGLSASIYTQTTDVETETNGLMTYDRKINKMGAVNVSNANKDIIPPFLVSSDTVFTQNYRAELKNSRPGGIIYYTTDGTEPTEKSTHYTSPVIMNSPGVIKAFTVWSDGRSRVASYEVKK